MSLRIWQTRWFYADVPVEERPERGGAQEPDYRSKKSFERGGRIIDIPGGDTCARCGTHVSTTGEVVSK